MREKVKETSLKRRIRKTLNTKVVVAQIKKDFDCCSDRVSVENVESEIEVEDKDVDKCIESKEDKHVDIDKLTEVKAVTKDDVEKKALAVPKLEKKAVKKEKLPKTKRTRKVKRTVETMESLVADFVESFLTGIEDDSLEGELSKPFPAPPAPSNIFDKIQSNIPAASPRYNINSNKFFKSFKNCQQIIQEEAQREFEETAKLTKNLKFLDSINTTGYEWITANNTNLEQFHDNTTISDPGVNWDVLEEYIKEDSKTTPLVPLTAEDIDQFFAQAITCYYHIPHYHNTDLTNYTYSNLFNVPPWSDVPVPSIPNVPDSYTPNVGTKSPCLKNVYSYRRRSSEASNC